MSVLTARSPNIRKSSSLRVKKKRKVTNNTNTLTLTYNEMCKKLQQNKLANNGRNVMSDAKQVLRTCDYTKRVNSLVDLLLTTKQTSQNNVILRSIKFSTFGPSYADIVQRIVCAKLQECFTPQLRNWLNKEMVASTSTKSTSLQLPVHSNIRLKNPRADLNDLTTRLQKSAILRLLITGIPETTTKASTLVQAVKTVVQALSKLRQDNPELTDLNAQTVTVDPSELARGFAAKKKRLDERKKANVASSSSSSSSGSTTATPPATAATASTTVTTTQSMPLLQQPLPSTVSSSSALSSFLPVSVFSPSLVSPPPALQYISPTLIKIRLLFNDKRLRCMIHSSYNVHQLHTSVSDVLTQTCVGGVSPNDLTITDSYGFLVGSGGEAITANNSGPLTVRVSSFDTEGDEEHAHTDNVLEAYSALMNRSSDLKSLFQGVASDNEDTRKYHVDFLRAVVNKNNSSSSTSE
jgi:hypothetical protein